jgi:membrane-associated HD superfamily phosphohydrolase
MIKDLYDIMDEGLRMSTKKESDKTTTRTAGGDDTTAYRSPTSSLSEQQHSVERVLDETRDNVRRTIEEARRDIPRNTQAINDCQEQYLRSAREITDEFLNSQKEIVKSVQSTLAPYIENGYQEFWNKWASPQKAAEIYAKTVSNFADNAIVTTRIVNNALFANMEALKTIIEHRRDDVKEFSRLAVNTAKTFEQTSRDAANP